MAQGAISTTDGLVRTTKAAVEGGTLAGRAFLPSSSGVDGASHCCGASLLLRRHRWAHTVSTCEAGGIASGEGAKVSVSRVCLRVFEI